MFDLDREVNAWCESVHAGRCRAGPSIEELADHLHCEIERLQGKGYSAERAFEQATARLGDTGALDREFDKNRSWLSRAYHALGLAPERMTREERRMRMVNSFIWAALILASALIFKGITADTSASYGYLLTAVFIPLWFAADQLLLRVMRSRR